MKVCCKRSAYIVVVRAGLVSRAHRVRSQYTIAVHLQQSPSPLVTRSWCHRVCGQSSQHSSMTTPLHHSNTQYTNNLDVPRTNMSVGLPPPCLARRHALLTAVLAAPLLLTRTAQVRWGVSSATTAIENHLRRPTRSTQRSTTPCASTSSGKNTTPWRPTSPHCW